MLLNGGELDGKRLSGPSTVALIAENHLERGASHVPGLGFAVVKDRAGTGSLYSVGSYSIGVGLKALCSVSTPLSNWSACSAIID